jgi:hypothetical protein
VPQPELAVKPGSVLSTTTLKPPPDPAGTALPALGALSWWVRLSAVT